MGDTATPKSPFAFYSNEGRKTIRDIARQHLPFDPHDYSIEVAARILDGQDVLVRTACAGGKTGTIALIAVLLRELRKDESLVKYLELPREGNPIIVVVCPTNALELDIVRILILTLTFMY